MSWLVLSVTALFMRWYAAAAGPPGHPQLIQQAQQGPAVVIAQGGLHLDLPDGVAGLLCVAQHVLDGALAQLSYQGLLQLTASVLAAASWLLIRQSHRLEDKPAMSTELELLLHRVSRADSEGV